MNRKHPACQCGDNARDLGCGHAPAKRTRLPVSPFGHVHENDEAEAWIGRSSMTRAKTRVRANGGSGAFDECIMLSDGLFSCA